MKKWITFLFSTLTYLVILIAICLNEKVIKIKLEDMYLLLVFIFIHMSAGICYILYLQEKE